MRLHFPLEIVLLYAIRIETFEEKLWTELTKTFNSAQVWYCVLLPRKLQI